nr:MAG TPA: hypothetical protein [Caudoviricetes sp.]
MRFGIRTFTQPLLYSVTLSWPKRPLIPFR